MKTLIYLNNSMKLAFWLIVMTLSLLPWAVMQNGLPLMVLLACFVIYMSSKKMKGVTFVVMAIGVCLPFVARMDDQTKFFFNSHFSWLNRTIYFCLLGMFLTTLTANRSRILENFFPKSALVIVSVLAILNAARFGIDGAVSWLFKILVLPVFFWICYHAKEKWNEIFHMFTVIFVGCAIYAILDFFLKAGPYMPLREGAFDIFELYRAGGLQGNSLTLTGFLMCYHSCLLINYHYTGKLSKWLVVLSLLTIFMTGSRTAAVVLVIEWLMFIIYLSKGHKERVRNIIVLLVVAVIIYGIALYFFKDYIDAFFERFSEGNEHRESGIQTTFNVFRANPWGVGGSGVENAFDQYAAAGWSGGMKTVDNAYLTFIISDGILAFIPFLFYFFVPLFAIVRSWRYREYRALVMLCAPYMLCGLAFCVNSFMQLNLLYCGLAGHMLRIIIKEKNARFISNNS